MSDFEFIKGYENLYKINRNGEIYSCSYKKIMKPTNDEYAWVRLKKDGISHKGRIHRLLALQYIDNPENKPQVDHIDKNRFNNSLDNLRWATHTENMNNKFCNVANLTPEELEERKKELTKYKKEWAEKDRRERGLKIKSEMTKTLDPEYKAKWAREKRASMTQDERDKVNARKRELRALAKTL